MEIYGREFEGTELIRMSSYKHTLRELSFEVVIINTQGHTMPLVQDSSWHRRDIICSESLQIWDRKETCKQGFGQSKLDSLLRTETCICRNKDVKIIIFQTMQLKHKLHKPHKFFNPRGTQLQFGNLEHEGNMLFHKFIWGVLFEFYWVHFRKLNFIHKGEVDVLVVWNWSLQQKYNCS